MAQEGKVRLILLAEDKRSATFIRKMIVKLNIGVTDRTIRERIAPSGKGSGKAWIDQEFPTELSAYRSKNYQGNIGLAVATDADDETVAQRKQKVLAGTKREKAEKICLLIPKWSIETWLLHFNGIAVSEDEKSKHEFEKKVKDKSVGKEAEKFVEEFRKFKTGEELVTLPALEEAYQELSRFI